MGIKYVHIHLVAKDWKKLVKFYIDVFNCREKLPKRDLKGKWLDDATGIKNLHEEGMHLYLPGYDDNGPTLEIYQYSEIEDSNEKKINNSGFGHIAFAVDDVERYIELIK